MVGNWRITFLHLFYFLSLVMIVSPNAIIHLVRFFVRCTLYTCAPSLTRTDFFCKVWKRALMTPYYWILIKIRAMMARVFSYSGRYAKISLKFYGQSTIFCWFVRKFLTIMMRIYGQSRLFGPFVRNRHFSGGPITDKESIFSDVSVNDSDFDKCSVANPSAQSLHLTSVTGKTVISEMCP